MKQLLKPLASLRLTVTLLALSMVLIFAATWAQRTQGIWQVQSRYVYSWFCWVGLDLFLPSSWNAPAGFPMPGGYTLGAVILANLLSAHFIRFKWTWKRLGVILIHVGLILLIVGELWSSLVKIETRMTIDVGQKINFAEDIREVELAVIDPSPADHDHVTIIPKNLLATGNVIDDPQLPFRLKIDEFYSNSTILGPRQAADAPQANPGTTSRATAGAGVSLTAVPRPLSNGTDSAVDTPSAYVTVLDDRDQPLATYLLSLISLDPGFAAIDRPQAVQFGDKTYYLHLRFRRYYKPYTIELLKFSHDRYTGTDIPKNFASVVRLTQPTMHEDREVKIWMNHPLRYAGETFYQASFKPNDQTTILEVVHNPGWLMPYIACIVGALGLILHFGMLLIQFLSRQLAPAPQSVAAMRKQETYTLPPRHSAGPLTIALPALAVALGLVYLISAARPAPLQGPYDLRTFGKLPISFEGRVQPLDTLARTSLTMISGREELTIDGQKLTAIHWLADVFGQPEKSADYPVVRIDDPGIIGVLDLDPNHTRFSIKQVLAKGEELNKQFMLASQADEKERNSFQKAVLDLGQKIDRYLSLGQMGGLFLIPPDEQHPDWQPFAPAVDQGRKTGQMSAAADTWLSLLDAYEQNNPTTFNQTVQQYLNSAAQQMPLTMGKIQSETFFRQFDPYAQCMVLYVIVFLLAAVSWLGWRRPMANTALAILALTFLLHSTALVARIYISGRPPVTNLSSSAVFIAWFACLLAIGLEVIFRNGLGSAATAIIGACSLWIARGLAMGTDDMKVLQAVLDTNFWLATHVVTITMGYGATFLAGILAVAYILGGVFTSAMNPNNSKALSRMVYGILCFAMLFSFVGTILGGIWADQSWGRFWGWDPKENGALLIVLWVAICLHARWSGLVKQRGLMLLAIFGNIVTAWSWFGTNMLGVGLHSYGFMDTAMKWLLTFIATQLALIALGSLPLNRWRSFIPQADPRPIRLQ